MLEPYLPHFWVDLDVLGLVFSVTGMRECTCGIHYDIAFKASPSTP